MKKFRKIAAVLLCIVMIAASLQCLAFAAPQDSGELNFLVLGDSIAEGFGVENKEDAAYGKIVADTNGYNYRNLAQVANDTQDLIRKIETVDEFRESIAWADIINICIEQLPREQGCRLDNHRRAVRNKRQEARRDCLWNL